MRPIASIGLLLLTIPGAIAAQAAPVRLEPVTRIGCVDCSGPELFSSILDIAIGADRVYVAEAAPPFIRVFDTRGRAILSFGRRGDGPGELRLPIHLGLRAGGVLEIYDMTQSRFTRFDSAGAVLGTRRMNGFTVVAESVPGAGAAYLVTTDFRTMQQPVARLSDSAESPAALTTLGSDFPAAPPGHPAHIPAVAARPGGGIAVGDGRTEYRIRRFDDDGKVVSDIVRNVPKQRKTTAELDVERDRYRRNSARMAAMRRAEGGKGAPSGFTPSEERNHFGMDALEYDESGRLWVRTERGGLNATIFDIFDPSDLYLGELKVPQRLGTFALRGGLLAARVIDDDEVQYVGIWRIR